MTLLGLALAAHVWAAEKPDWLSGRSANYPAARFVTGVAQASGADKAADKARTEVAKAFGVSLYARTETSERESSSGGYRQDVSDEVFATTSKVLDGVEIAERWQDEGGTHYALAVLDREHSLKVMADKLAELDAQFVKLAGELAGIEGRWQKLGRSLKILDNVRARKELNADYRVLNPEGKGIAAPDKAADAVALAKAALAEITVRVESKGEESELVAERLREKLQRHGLKVKSRAEEPDLLIVARSEGRALPAENLLWLWAEARLNVALLHDGEELERFGFSGQAAARDPEDALRQALRSLSDKAAAQSYRLLLSSRVEE
jgi:hypothetical protein